MKKTGVMKRRLFLNRAGFALVLVMILISFMVIFTTAFSRTMLSNYREARDNENAALAFYVADSGLQYTIERISSGNATTFSLRYPDSIIKTQELSQAPDVAGEVDVNVEPPSIATSPSTHKITCKSELKRVRNGVAQEILARRILIAEVTYRNDSTTQSSVQVNYWYEQNR